MDDNNVKKFELKAFQDDFIYSPSPHPAMIAGWGTGKSMCLIFRGMIYSEEIDHNLGVIFRKQRKDLEDSTILDFEKYTGISVNKDKMDVVLPNGSRILFRHIEELSGAKKRKGENIQNMNLGWFGIEQMEELETDNEFFFLFGRLRRVGKVSDYFKSLGLAERSGFGIGNVYGDNWIRRQWKDIVSKEFELVEATTYDNADNLPKDFMDKIEILKQRKPEIYNRYVMNDWHAAVEAKVFCNVDKCVAGELQKPIPGYHYVGGTDLAKTQDWTTIFIICRETNHLVYFARFQKLSWSLQKQKINAVKRIYNNASMLLDSTGVGDPILEDMERAGGGVEGFKFNNKSKTQLIEKLIVAFDQRLFTMPYLETVYDEIKAFEGIMLPSGKVRYQAPPGLHDDCVTGLALAVWELDLYASHRELPEPTPFWNKVKGDIVYSQAAKVAHSGQEGIYRDVFDDGYEPIT